MTLAFVVAVAALIGYCTYLLMIDQMTRHIAAIVVIMAVMGILAPYKTKTVPVEVERVVEKPVVVEKMVPVDRVVEKIVEVEKPIERDLDPADKWDIQICVSTLNIAMARDEQAERKRRRYAEGDRISTTRDSLDAWVAKYHPSR